MPKYRRRKKRQRPRQRDMARLELALDRVDQLVERGDPEGGLALLEPLAEEFGHVFAFQSTCGLLLSMLGAFEEAIGYLEAAYRQEPEPMLLMTLPAAYVGAGMIAHALQTLERIEKAALEIPPELIEDIEALRQDMADQAAAEGVPLAAYQQGSLAMERSTYDLVHNDERGALKHARIAVKTLPDSAAARTLLGETHSQFGRWRDAETQWTRVLEASPAFLPARLGLIRHYAWTHRRDEAEALWTPIAAMQPDDEGDLLHLAEAAALLEQDEHVQAWLGSVDFDEIDEFQANLLQRRLAVAEANLGEAEAALQRLRALDEPEYSVARQIRDALAAGKRSLGLIDRFRYIHSTEILPPFVMLELSERFMDETATARQIFQHVRRLAKTYPQFLYMIETLIWAEGQVEMGVDLLSGVGTPAAFALLRRLGEGQLGDVEDRMRALIALREAGQMDENERVRFWNGQTWSEIELRTLELTEPGFEADASPEVAAVYNAAIDALAEGRDDDAFDLLTHVIALDPDMAQAYNNLAIVHMRGEEYAQARDLLEEAIARNPEYPNARLNLFRLHVYDEEWDKAREMVAQLTNLEQMTPENFATLLCCQATLAAHDERFDEVERLLDQAADVRPGLPLIESTRAYADRASSAVVLRQGWEKWQQDQAIRNAAARARLQSKLTNKDVTLAQAIGLYSAEVLKKSGPQINGNRKWYKLRKKELQAALLADMNDPTLVRELYDYRLDDEERAALQAVLAAGGSLPWSDFADRFGDDTDESPHWQYHEPESVIGRLRFLLLLTEATVDGELRVVVPLELRSLLPLDRG